MAVPSAAGQGDETLQDTRMRPCRAEAGAAGGLISALAAYGGHGGAGRRRRSPPRPGRARQAAGRGTPPMAPLQEGRDGGRGGCVPASMAEGPSVAGRRRKMRLRRVLELKERLGRAEQPAEVAGGRRGSPRVASGLRPRLGAPGGRHVPQVPLAP